MSQGPEYWPQCGWGLTLPVAGEDLNYTFVVFPHHLSLNKLNYGKVSLTTWPRFVNRAAGSKVQEIKVFFEQFFYNSNLCLVYCLMPHPEEVGEAYKTGG